MSKQSPWAMALETWQRTTKNKKVVTVVRGSATMQVPNGKHGTSEVACYADSVRKLEGLQRLHIHAIQ